MNITLGIPQIIWIVLVIMGLGVEMAQHGKPRTGKHNFWTMLISFGLSIWILYAGGFFG